MPSDSSLPWFFLSRSEEQRKFGLRNVILGVGILGQDDQVSFRLLEWEDREEWDLYRKEGRFAKIREGRSGDRILG